MKIRRVNCGKTCFDRAFTLIELMAVMAIMATLLALTVPAISGVNESVNISQGGQLFADQVALARQISSARNLTVEVRCINLPALSANGYSAIQLWAPSTGQPLSRLQRLPDGIAISQDKTTYSTLFGSYNSTGSMPAGGPVSGDTYVSFTINPSGMVGPLSGSAPDMKTLTVGVLPARLATATALSGNYMLVQLNPLTAATLNYRP